MLRSPSEKSTKKFSLFWQSLAAPRHFTIPHHFVPLNGMRTNLPFSLLSSRAFRLAAAERRGSEDGVTPVHLCAGMLLATQLSQRQ